MRTLKSTNGTAAIDYGDGVPRPIIRVNEHVPPAMVGIGVMLAGAAMPGLQGIAGQWAVIQGRKPRTDEGESRARVEVDKQGGASVVHTEKLPRSRKPREDSSDEDEEDVKRRNRKQRGSFPNAAHANTSSFNLSNPSATAPNLSSPIPSQIASTPYLGSDSPIPSPRQKGEDPFGQTSSPSGSRPSTPPRQSVHQPFYSVPDFSTSQGNQHSSALRRLHPTDRPPPAEALLATYSPEAQRQLLRSHYCRSQIRFLLLLEDISNRLLVIPKPARVSALRAELTSLNHNLPAEVCMPLWCAADHSHEKGGQTASAIPLKARPKSEKSKAHSRVVRISPGDSVVLNSAERAPFLLHVEILEGDLDFEPSNRANRDLLKKIVVQEDMKRRKKEGGILDPSPQLRSEGFGAAMPDIVPPVHHKRGLEEPTRKLDRQDSVDSTSRRDIVPDDMEEMDLVEQLYGAKLSVKDVLPDMSDSIPLPSAPKNKALDKAVWDRGIDSSMSRRSSFSPASTPHQPSFTPDSLSAQRVPSPGPGVNDTPAGRSDASGNTTYDSSSFATSPKRVITLEDYSERMRTAAVMLAQLNASLVPAVPEGQANGSGASSARSWIPGTGWITGSKQDSAQPSPEGPPGSAGGKLKLAAAQAAAIREKIMEEMMALEEERVTRMTERPEGVEVEEKADEGGEQTAEDEGIVRRELNKADPSGESRGSG